MAIPEKTVDKKGGVTVGVRVRERVSERELVLRPSVMAMPEKTVKVRVKVRLRVGVRVHPP
jgi:hypothetical protein